ncbi:MAG TPA: hypothetical protein VGG35_06965 [Streptosporangiaceae bacterium]|jgi:hypothetical protein
MTHMSTSRRASGLAALAITAAAAAGLAGCKSSSSAGSASSPAAAATSTASATSDGSGGSASSGGSSSSASGSDYFPVAEGNTWVYKSELLGGSSTVRDKIIRVVPVADGKKVTMRTDESGETVITTTYVFHDDGSISVPFGSLAGSDVKVVGGSGVYWPSVADSAPGTTRKSTLRLVGSSVGHVTAHITVTSGGSKKVTVPAGTYDARAVLETIRETVAGHTITVRLTTYLAAGIGPVKTVMDGSVGETLKSFRHG